MPKQKTKKAAAKRFKITKGGKILRHRTHKSHLMEGKTQKKKRGLRKMVSISPTDIRRVKRSIPGL